MTNAGDSLSHVQQDGDAIDTVQSLFVAFVLAMTFRGFITEGFVIPTGSMAPTLLGQHALVESQMTGSSFAVGLDQSEKGMVSPDRIADPMLGENFPGSGVPEIRRKSGMGDRILVLKALLPFADPHRFDVVVFKNPTDPIGDTSNYIKRLIGVPNEQVWLTDGDVFAKPLGHGAAGDNEFHIQRKPEHVQRAVWQRVHDSDFIPLRPDKLDRRYEGPPWSGDDSIWDLNGRSYRNASADPSVLTWDSTRRSLNDWTPYNMLGYMRQRTSFVPVSDVRVSAAIVADQPGLISTLELQARSHMFQFIVESKSNGQGLATLRMKPLTGENTNEDWVQRTATITLPAPGKVFNVEFWHADQTMSMFIDGRRVMEPLEYDWTPLQRLQYATGDFFTTDVDALLDHPPQPPQIRWRFAGSPVTLHHIRTDRDLYYRHDVLDKLQKNEPHIYGQAFGTHPTENAAILGPDQFMMCGDNSQMSLDSRLWGRPHPLVQAQIGDDHAFTVNRKLLIGKAWVVYFPAPHAITDGGPTIVPDFGRLRFIR